MMGQRLTLPAVWDQSTEWYQENEKSWRVSHRQTTDWNTPPNLSTHAHTRRIHTHAPVAENSCSLAFLTPLPSLMKLVSEELQTLIFYTVSIKKLKTTGPLRFSAFNIAPRVWIFKCSSSILNYSICFTILPLMIQTFRKRVMLAFIGSYLVSFTEQCMRQKSRHGHR